MLAFYNILSVLLKILSCVHLIFALAPQVRAAPDSSRTSQVCTTEWAFLPESPASTVTSTEIRTFSNIVVETFIPAITRTIEAPMVIVTTDRLSLITVPQTISELTTQTSVVTVTVTITQDFGDEKTSTIIPSTSTVTIPTPPGFRRPTPAPFHINKREAAGLQGLNGKVLESMETRSEGLSLRETNRKLHKRVTMPSRVLCTDLITVIKESTRTITGTSTTTIDLYVPSHTLYAGLVASTVVQSDALITMSSTIIEETQTTIYVTERAVLHNPPTPTVFTTIYDACSGENLLTNLHDEAIGQVREGPDFYAIEEFKDAQTPYDCCVACITHANCGGASYKPSGLETDLRGRCRGLLGFTECDPGKVVGYFERYLTPTVYDTFEDGIHISSGHCGHLEQGND